MIKTILTIGLSLFVLNSVQAEELNKTDDKMMIDAYKMYVIGQNLKPEYVKKAVKKRSNKKAKQKKLLPGPPGKMTVTATAYTSHVNQTDSTPNIAAWGDRIHAGMKLIAVSRDMLEKYGLKHRSKVKIKGFEGEYLVLDKMNKRWKKKIDIYMGMDLKKAYAWGKRKVVIEWDGNRYEGPL